MRPICLINQPTGLGDICFIQKLVDRVIADGYDVNLPVISEYSWIRYYIQKPHLSFDSIRLPPNPDQVLPLVDSGKYYPMMSVIAAKYHMLRMNYDNWQDHFTFRRLLSKEQGLVDRLGLRGIRYNLISNKIKSPPNVESIDIGYQGLADNGLMNVYVEQIGDYTPFDWARVIEQATNLFFVDSCFTFIIEKLELKAESMHLFSRTHSEGGVHSSLVTQHMFKQPWRLAPPRSS